MKVLCAAIGLRHIHSHISRHGIAIHLQGQGVLAELIAYHLAHSSTAITLSTYARLHSNQEKRMLESLGVRIQ